MSRGKSINYSGSHVKIGVRERYYRVMYALSDMQHSLKTAVTAVIVFDINGQVSDMVTVPCLNSHTDINPLFKPYATETKMK